MFTDNSCPNQQINANHKQIGVKANRKQTREKANRKQTAIERFSLNHETTSNN